MPLPAHLRSVGRALLLSALGAALFAAVLHTAAQPQQQAGAAQPQQQPGAAQRRQQAAAPRRDPDERAAGGERSPNDDGSNHDGSVEPGVTLLLTPSRARIAPGDRLRLSLAVLGADDLRRLPATVRFDPDVLEPVSVRLGSAWDGGPRPVLLHDASRPGELVLGLGLLDRRQQGISGSVELLEIEFRAVGRGDAQLRIERFAVIGPDARPRPSTALGADIAVR